MLSQKQKDFIKSCWEELQEMETREKNKEIAKRFQEQFNQVLDKKYIYEVLKRSKSKVSEAKEAVDEAVVDEEKKRFEIVEKSVKYYEFDVSYHTPEGGKEKNKIQVPAKTLSKMFFDFSVHGANLTEDEMIRKYSLSPEEWYAIKKSVRLYKKSNAFGEIMYDQSNGEDVETFFNNTFREKMQRRSQEYIKKYKEEEYKFLKNCQKQVAKMDYLVDNITEALRLHKKVYYTPVENKKDEGKFLVIHLTDVHYGSEHEDMRTGIKHNKELVKKRFGELVDYVIGHQKKNVHIFAGGDFVEFAGVGEMHPWQMKHLDVYAIDQILQMVDIMAECIQSIAEKKYVTVDIVSGNHDRLTEMNEKDSDRLGWYLFGTLLKKQLPHVEINHNNHFCKRVIDGVGFILTHWEFADGKRSTPKERISAMFNTWADYNVHLLGHYHAQEGSEGVWIIQQRTPAMCPSNDYSNKQMRSNIPWFTKVEVNWKYPNIETLRFSE